MGRARCRRTARWRFARTAPVASPASVDVTSGTNSRYCPVPRHRQCFRPPGSGGRCPVMKSAVRCAFSQVRGSVRLGDTEQQRVRPDGHRKSSAGGNDVSVEFPWLHPVAADADLRATQDLHPRHPLAAKQDGRRQGDPMPQGSGGQHRDVHLTVVRFRIGQQPDAALQPADISTSTDLTRWVIGGSSSRRITARIGRSRRCLTADNTYAGAPNRAFNVVDALSIIAASKPMPAITANTCPSTSPTSSRRRPCSTANFTPAAGSSGRPRLVASKFPVPAGSTANAASVPTRPAITERTVPSPPQTKTSSAPCATACRACPVPVSCGVVSNQAGNGHPAAANDSSITRRRWGRSCTRAGLTTTADRSAPVADGRRRSTEVWAVGSGAASS